MQLIGTYDANPTLRFYVPGDRMQVRLPPDVLVPGSTYCARVTADGSPHSRRALRVDVVGRAVPVADPLSRWGDANN